MSLPGRPGGSTQTFGSEAEKLVHQKNARTLLALIRGARDPEWAEALAAAEGATDDPRKRVVGRGYQKAAELRDGSPTTSSDADSAGGQA